MDITKALSGLLGGPQQQADYGNFVQRYHNGPPSEGYTDQEVTSRYNQVATRLPPEDYRQAATEAFERMSPQERQQFAQHVQQQTQQYGPPLNSAFGQPYEQYQDSNTLARATSQVQQQQPDLIGSLLGSGGMLSNPIAKAALAGVAAMAAQRFLGGRR